jgi:hypothetical protein
MRLRKNFSTKKIWPVSDLDPDPGYGSGFESGSETGSETSFRPDPELLFRIRNTGGEGINSSEDARHCCTLYIPYASTLCPQPWDAFLS